MVFRLMVREHGKAVTDAQPEKGTEVEVDLTLFT